MVGLMFRLRRSVGRFGTFVLLALVALGLLAGCAAGGGQGGGSEYPTDEIEFVVPYDPGGGYDSWARLLAPFLEKHLPGDVNVVVKNVPGAGGLTAANRMYAAKPDGSMIQILNLNGLAAAQVSGQLNFELDEYTYLGRVASDPQILYVSGDSEINNIEDLKAAAPIKQAMTGFTSSEGVNTVIVYDVFGIEFSPVMHDGSEEATLSVVRGDTDAGIGSLESVLGNLQSRDLKPILYMGEEKPKEGEPGYEEVKDVQTIQETGNAELAAGLEAQRVIGAPPDLPEDIERALEKAIEESFKDPKFVEKAKESELTPNPLDAEETTEVVNNALDTINQYEDVLKETIEKNK